MCATKTRVQPRLRVLDAHVASPWAAKYHEFDMSRNEVR